MKIFSVANKIDFGLLTAKNGTIPGKVTVKTILYYIIYFGDYGINIIFLVALCDNESSGNYHERHFTNVKFTISSTVWASWQLAFLMSGPGKWAANSLTLHLQASLTVTNFWLGPFIFWALSLCVHLDDC